MPNVVDKAITDLESAQIIQDEDLFVVEQNDTAKSVSGALIKQYASVNAIETVKVNGTALTPDADRAVNVIVPTKTSDLTNDSGYITSSEYDPATKTGDMTQSVGVDSSGKLWTAPGGSSLDPVAKTDDMIYPVGVDSSGKLWASVAPGTLSWSQIQSIVRSGMASVVFPVGYEFTTTKTIGSDTTVVTWRVVAHNHHRPANTSLYNSMTLESKYAYSGANGSFIPVQFCAKQAMYYCAEGLAAGTYHFTWNYSTGSLVTGTYQFTLGNAVPAGGQIVFNDPKTGTAITSWTISTYSTAGGSTSIESNISVSAGSAGTDLGSISVNAVSDANLNCASRILFGSNNYAQSAVRQFINSSASLGSVWTAATKFDRPAAWQASIDAAYAGYLNGIDSDFLSAVQTAKITCRTNDAFEIGSLDGTAFSTNQTYELQDKFFLISYPEITGLYDNTNIKDGTILEYYNGLSPAEWITRDVAGTARGVWLRSPTSGSNTERFSAAGGYISGAEVYFPSFCTIAPACIIA